MAYTYGGGYLEATYLSSRGTERVGASLGQPPVPGIRKYMVISHNSLLLDILGHLNVY